MSESNDGGLAERGGTSNVSGTGSNFGGSGGPTGSGGSNSSNVGVDHSAGHGTSSYPSSSNVRSAYPPKSIIGQPGTTYKFGWQPEYVSDTMSPDEWYGATHPSAQNEGHIAMDNPNGWDGSLGDMSHFSSNPRGAGGDNSGQGGMGAGALTNRPAGYGGGIGADNPMSPGFAERQAAARLNRAEAGGDRPVPPGVGGLQQPPRPVNPPLSGGRGGEGGHVQPPHIQPPHVRPPHTPGPRGPRPGGGPGGGFGHQPRSLSDIAGGGQIRRFARGGHLPGYAQGGEADGLGLVGDREGTADMELIDAPGGASITPVMDDDGDDALRDSAVRHITQMLFGGKKGGHTGGGAKKDNAGGNVHGDRTAARVTNQAMRENDSNTGFGGNQGGGGSGPPDNDGTGQPRGFGINIGAGNTDAPPPGNPRAFFGGVHKVQPPQTGYAFRRPRAMGNPNGTGSRVPGLSMNLPRRPAQYGPGMGGGSGGTAGSGYNSPDTGEEAL